MRKVLTLLTFLAMLVPKEAWSQDDKGTRLLTLEECRAMALSNNKQLRTVLVKQDIA